MSKLYKEIILAVATMLLGIFSWWFLKYVFYFGNLTTLHWIMGGIIFILWGIAVSLAMLLIQNKRIIYGSLIIVLGAFGMFFNNEPFYYLVGLIILFVAFVVGTAKVKREEEVQVKLNFFRIWKRGLPIFITALAILIAMVYYFSPTLDKFEKKEIVIPRKTFNIIITPFESLIKARLPEQVVDLDNKAIDILKPQELEDLKKTYGIEVKQNETIRDLLYQLTEYQINSTNAPYGKFIPIGLAIALFLALKLVGFFYIPIVILFTWLFLRVLILLKFSKFAKEIREVETVKL